MSWLINTKTFKNSSRRYYYPNKLNYMSRTYYVSQVGVCSEQQAWGLCIPSLFNQGLHVFTAVPEIRIVNKDELI